MALWKKTVGTRIIALYLKSLTCETNFEQENRTTDIKAATKFHSKDALMSLPKAHICELYADLKKLEENNLIKYVISISQKSQYLHPKTSVSTRGRHHHHREVWRQKRSVFEKKL